MDLGPLFGLSVRADIFKKIREIKTTAKDEQLPWECGYVTIFFDDPNASNGWSYHHSKPLTRIEDAERLRTALSDYWREFIKTTSAVSTKIIPQQFDFSAVEARVASHLYGQATGRMARPGRSECPITSYRSSNNIPNWGINTNDEPNDEPSDD